MDNIVCKKCGIEKHRSEYYKDKHRASGLKHDNICKKCILDYKNNKVVKQNNEQGNISKEDLLKLYDDTEYDKGIAKKTHFSSLFIGSSKSGKSTLIKHMIKELEERYDLIIIFSQSLHDPMYDFINYGEKSKYIAFDDFNKSIINDIFKLNKLTKNALNVLVLFDDLVNLSTRDNNEITQMFIRGRNSGISILYSTQHYSLMNKAVRANANYIFLLRTNSPSVRISLAEHFLYNILPVPISNQSSKTRKLEYYNNYIMDKTQNYGIIIVDNLSDPPKILNYKV